MGVRCRHTAAGESDYRRSRRKRFTSSPLPERRRREPVDEEEIVIADQDLEPMYNENS